MWYEIALKRLDAEKQLAEYEGILNDIISIDDSIGEIKKRLVDSLNRKIALKKEEIFIYRKAEEQKDNAAALVFNYGKREFS